MSEQLYAIDGSRGSDHGCKDWAVARDNGDGTATIVSADSCHSCWPVGHDQAHVFFNEGDVIDLSNWQIASVGAGWSTDITHELYSQYEIVPAEQEI